MVARRDPSPRHAVFSVHQRRRNASSLLGQGTQSDCRLGRRRGCAAAQRASLEYVDRLLAQLFDKLKHFFAVVCGDHGDCWGEDGLWGHGFYHPMVMRVPMTSTTVRRPCSAGCDNSCRRPLFTCSADKDRSHAPASRTQRRSARTAAQPLRIPKCARRRLRAAGSHSQAFMRAGKHVTSIDLSGRLSSAIRADYMSHEFAEPFDCLWISHVLEHQLQPHDFLQKAHGDLRKAACWRSRCRRLSTTSSAGTFAGNLGLLLYHLILAGFDCSQARCRRYDYNISVVVKKHTIDVPRHG